RNQLAARGIDLVVLPVSVKPSTEGEMLAVSNANRTEASDALPNPSFNEFKARLEREKVRLFDPAPFLMERGRNGHRYLETDTHWRPETMEVVRNGWQIFSNCHRRQHHYRPRLSKRTSLRAATSPQC